MEDQPTSRNLHPMPLVIIVASILGFFFLILFLKSRLLTTYPNAPTSAISPSPATLQKGELLLRVKESSADISLAKPLTIQVYANSDNKPIVGYDVILNYNPEVVSLTSNASLLTDFQSIVQKGKNNIKIVAFKNPASQKSIVFANTPLVEILFTPKRTGVSNFSLEYIPGSTKDSNLMTEESDTKDILGGVENVSVTVNK